jgi:hypothetical protein
MISLKSIIEESDMVRVDGDIASITGPTISPEQKMIRIPQLNWKDFMEYLKSKISKSQNLPDDKAWKLTYGIFGGNRILFPSMYDVISKITPIQMETLNFYTEGNAETIILRAKELYNDFASTYNQGYGMLKGQKKAKMF